MIIRPAKPDDAAALAALWNPVIRDTAFTFNSHEKSENDLRAMIADKARAGYAFHLAELSNRVVGFCTYGPFRQGPGYARTMEHTIIVHPDVHGTGIGRALLRSIEEHAQAAEIHSLFAGVSAENPKGRAFHAAQGYAEVAVLQRVGWKFGRWMDLVLMQKFLT